MLAITAAVLAMATAESGLRVVRRRRRWWWWDGGGCGGGGGGAGGMVVGAAAAAAAAAAPAAHQCLCTAASRWVGLIEAAVRAADQR